MASQVESAQASTRAPASDPERGTEAARARRKARATLIRRGVLALLGLGLSGAIVVAFLPDPIGVDAARVTRGPLVVTVDEDGHTRVKDRFIVSAPLLGNLARIELHAGDAVEPGTVLARLLPLDPPLLDARARSQAEARVAATAASRKQADSSVLRARTALELVSKQTQRQRALLGGGATSAAAYEQADLQERTLREELASAEFGARVAGHELSMAEAALGRLGKGARGDVLEITSPVKGRVLRVLQESGGAVQPGMPLIELGDPGALEIVVDVLTSDAVHVRKGAPVTIERWGGDHPLRAHVRLVEPSAFTRLSALGVEEQRVNVVIDLDEPQSSWTTLGDGYRVEAEIVTWKGDDVLSVPSSAVFRRNNTQAAIVIEDDHAHVRTIEVGRRNGERVAITKGLAEGTEVVLYPSDRIEEGVKIVRR